MGVHPRAVVFKQRFGHEGNRMPMPVRHIFQDILEPHELIPHFQQGLKPHIDLGLTGCGHLMVMGLNIDAETLQGQNHFGSEILEFIHGGYREIPFLGSRFVSEIRALFSTGIP